MWEWGTFFKVIGQIAILIVMAVLAAAIIIGIIRAASGKS